MELVLVLIVLILARVGYEGNTLTFGGADADFIGIGASVGLTFVLLAFIVCHLVGHLPPTLLVKNNNMEFSFTLFYLFHLFISKECLIFQKRINL